MNFSRALAGFFMILVVLTLPAVGASVNVESRIESAIEWLREQESTESSISGFLRGADSAFDSALYLEDQALVVLALSDYHFTHYTARYDDLLRVAASFISQARAPTGKFYEYYDLKNRRWVNAGGLYPWEAYAIAAMAVSAYKVTLASPEQRSYWSAVEGQLKISVSNLLSNQRSDGAWIFGNYTTGKHEALTPENALMLTGLSYIGLFEYQWGSSQQALYYGKLAERTASWLFSKQVANGTTAYYGGFPHSDMDSTEVSEENGVIMLGVNSYYTISALLDPQAAPTIWDARKVMIDWMAGFVRMMRDSYGGPYFTRSSNETVDYPKTTRAASWMLQALADIWVNLGGDAYYADSQKPYDWIVGANELQADLQGAASKSGLGLGFYSGIVSGVVDQSARSDVAASAVFALVRAGFIQVPEFPNGAKGLMLFLGFSVAFLAIGKGKKKLRNSSLQ